MGIDGFLVARKLARIGTNQGGLQMHGNGYRGPLYCARTTSPTPLGGVGPTQDARKATCAVFGCPDTPYVQVQYQPRLQNLQSVKLTVDNCCEVVTTTTKATTT